MPTEIRHCTNCKQSLYELIEKEHYYTCSNCSHGFLIPLHTTESADFIQQKAETLSPVMIGAKGKAGMYSFTVTGCLTLFQQKTTVNLHSITLNNGRESYLVESDGSYTFINDVDKGNDLDLKRTKLGAEIMLKDNSAFCFCTDKTRYISLAGTGKIPLDKYNDSIFCSYYLKDEQAAFCFFRKEETTLLLGTHYRFNDLQLTPLKTDHEWYQ